MADRAPAGAALTPIKPPVVKVVLDKVVSGLLLIVTSPLWLLIMAAVAAESALSRRARGGLFHTEVRVSAGVPFRLHKFRILTRQGEAAIRAGAVPKAVENDPRNLTRTGWLLKKVGFDELPQLLSIVTGDMSFVGPRPKPVNEYEDEIALGNVFRAQLRAGLTGPTQVLKGTHPSPGQGVRDEFAYAELLRQGSQRRILAADLKFLLKTVRVVLRATGE